MELNGFDWDLGNQIKSLLKHHITPRETEEIFLNGSAFIFPDVKHSQKETRHIAFGKTKSGKLLTVAFTLREKAGKNLLRPISARVMHKKERNLYEKATAKNQE